MAGRFLGLFIVLRGKKNKGPGAAPAEQPEEPEQIQTLQDDAAVEHTQEQQSSRGRFHRTLKMFRKFLRVQRRETGTSAAEGPAEPDSGLTEFQAEPDVSLDSAEHSQDSDTIMKEDIANGDKAVTEDVAMTNANTGETEATANPDTTPTPTLIEELVPEYFRDPCFSSQEQLSRLGSGLEASQDFVPPQAVITGAPQPLRPAHCGGKGSWGSCSLEERSKFPPGVLQVPAIVRNIHQRLLSHDTVDARLKIDIVRLAEEHPVDVVLTLLRCAPTCDRAAAMMWRAIASSRLTMEKVLPTLVRVMEDWPLSKMCTSDGDNQDVFALAATLVIWVIVQVPLYHETRIHSFYPLFTALLFHVVITTQQMPPEEVENFWRACQEENRLPCRPNRFAVQAMKALLYRLQCDQEVMDMERKCGWDTLLTAHTQHYAVGLLAREMRHVLTSMCSHVAYRLLLVLSCEKPRWDLPFLAFLVEVLECLDLSKCAHTVLKIMSSCLHSKCRERRRLALRGLEVLSKDPLMARPIRSVSRRLLELLGDADGQVVSMSLSLLKKMLQKKHLMISSTSASKLAEALLPLFDRDNSHLQLLSISLFCKVMELVVEEGKKPLKRIVSQSLLPLFLHCHEENQRVAEASMKTLYCAAGFLEKRDLQRVLKTEQPLKIDECLLLEDRRQASERMQWALRFLDSPQESLREAAFRIIGVAARYLSRKREELQFHSQAISVPRKDTSLSH
ncbi:maestro heat-like repeat-containing protein family member 6 [Passer domesticus]|uniref:maestro heat-like repeat-containing protein family member 6 n=1 Tax=Passer domesticus TaxID=48849 RepID=UPI0030FE5F6A